MLDLVANWDAITDDRAVILAMMVYGWMPTIPTLHLDHLPAAADVLQEVKLGKADLRRDELAPLRDLANNSSVGMSKMLHFVRPDLYPIWDGKVARHFHASGAPSQGWTNADGPRSDRYGTYRKNSLALVRDPRFNSVHGRIVGLVGYDVTKMRALDLVLWRSAPLQRS